MIVLVTGGSGSGKSAYAESRMLSLEGFPRYYIATMQVYDAESEVRVERHRQMRANKGFMTIEQPIRIGEAPVQQGACVLLECVSNLLSNEMFSPDGAGDHAEEAVGQGIEALASRCKHMVIVTNEVFSDGCVYGAELRAYIRALGNINRILARMADEVEEVVYGIPLRTH